MGLHGLLQGQIYLFLFTLPVLFHIYSSLYIHQKVKAYQKDVNRTKPVAGPEMSETSVFERAGVAVAP
jgi:hypothetical protein